MISAPAPSAASVRKRALAMLVITVALIPPAVWLFRFLAARFTGWGVVLLPAALIVPALISITELASGRSIGALSDQWDSLAGWQRGVIGTAVVTAAFGALAAAVILGAKLGLF